MSSATSDNGIVPPVRVGLNYLEQLHAESAIVCPNFTGFTVGIKHETRQVVASKLSCKKWSCPTCSAVNAKRWIARILDHLNNAHEPKSWFFVTITAHRKWRGAIASRKNLQQGWKKFYNRLRRTYGLSEYVKVWEAHADGSFHLHILIDQKLTKKWVKKTSVECGMGYQCDVIECDNAGKVAGYIAKYMTKSQYHAQTYPKGMRRIEVNRGFTAWRDSDSDPAWQWLFPQTEEGVNNTVSIYRQRGYTTSGA